MAEYQQMDMPEFNKRKILPIFVIGATKHRDWTHS